MIIGKQIRRALLGILCFAFVISAVSCSNSADSDALAELEKLQNSQTEDTEAVGDNVSKYRVVISAGATDTIFVKALELAAAIEEKTEKTCTVVRDIDELSNDGKTGEIQLGYVDRKESKEILRLHKRDDYLCIKFSDVIVLGGKSENATVTATDKFISETLVGAEGKRIMNDGDGFEVGASYTLSSIRLCGTDFSNYGIVITNQTQEIASAFRELLANKCGAYPDISFDTVVGVREIVFELSNGTQESFCGISYDGEDIIVSSDSVYGLSMAVYKLYDTINSSVVNGVGSVDISSPLVYSYEAEDMSVVSAAMNGNESFAFKNALASLCTETVDIITLGAVSQEAWMIAESSIPEEYSYEVCQLEGNMKFPVIYKKTSFDGLTVQITEDNNAIFASIGENGDCPCLLVAFEKIVDNRQTNVDKILKQVCESQYGAVGIFVSAVGNKKDFSAVYDGVSVEYLTSLGVGSASQSIVVAVTDGIIACKESECKNIQDGSAFYILTSVQNVYCEEFLTLTT